MSKETNQVKWRGIRLAHGELFLPVGISDGVELATVTVDGYLDVKSHSSDACFSADYAAAQAATIIITPPAGKRIKVVQVYVSTESIVVDIEMAFGAAGVPFFKLYTAKTQAHTGAIVCATGPVDEKIHLTCGDKTFVAIAYDIIE